MNLRKIQGPNCPKCGCNASTVVRLSTQWGKTIEHRACDYCLHVYCAPAADGPADGRAVDPPAPSLQPPASDDSGVAYPILRCPKCHSRDVRVTSTRRPVRHHQCTACRHRFKSVER